MLLAAVAGRAARASDYGPAPAGSPAAGPTLPEPVDGAEGVLPISYPPPPSFASALPNELVRANLPINYQSAPAIGPWLQSPVLTQHGWYDGAALARGYYVNDQRIEWSGQEATFGAEGAVAGVAGHLFGDWQAEVRGELYLNQPFDRNMLADTPERRSYLSNFEVDVLEISQLTVSAQRGDWLLSVGKMVTPFGRTYFPLYQNNRQDAPFIRSESILWRETGFLCQYQPGPWVLAAALTNGGDDRDANSSKALVSRIGIDTDWFATGASIKWQDGIGSEQQKLYNSHIGADMMWRSGPFTLSGEVIYDEYGFHRPDLDPNDITWRRGIYYREQNRAFKQPIHGVGYYLDLQIDRPTWTCMLNYGEFYPLAIGDPLHDVTTRRGIVKLIYYFTPHCSCYSMVLLENNVSHAQSDRTRKGQDVLVGFQYSL